MLKPVPVFDNLIRLACINDAIPLEPSGARQIQNCFIQHHIISNAAESTRSKMYVVLQLKLFGNSHSKFEDWARAPGPKNMWSCKLCQDGRLHEKRKLARHEASVRHQTLLGESLQSESEPRAASSTFPVEMTLVDSATRALLESMMGTPSRSQGVEVPPPSRSPSPSFLDPIYGWGVLSASDATQLDRSAEEEGVALIAQSLLARFEELSNEASDDERSEAEDEEDPPEPTVSSASQMGFHSLK